MSESACPFCTIDMQRIFYAGELVVGIWDEYPVSDGHALLLPKRHVESWFEATVQERIELGEATVAARNAILKRNASRKLPIPEGFNVGVNDGESAGQTVGHLHVHLIPRYSGDVPDPRGGVRYVIPHRANYLTDTKTESLGLARHSEAARLGGASASSAPGAGSRPPHVSPPVDVTPEPAHGPPANEVQTEALDAHRRTRAAGNNAGLVVLGTGLGKTYLAALDSNETRFRRILFVAHREEILAQAMETFRWVRPNAHMGYYSGQDKLPGADVLFASIQALGRMRHLTGFDRKAFDYVVVDEFHHAAASTYRRLIDYFRPKFMLGLTATPERTDGGDLLALCQENLVYRCDFIEGIRRGLLCPFRYFGVPDDVDYTNIPWRSARFDEEELTKALATQARAQNALDQYKAKAGTRTLAFCCSQRHADFMAEFFRNAGLRVASVHSGPSSDPRTSSLEKLRDGRIDVVFAVDMFNEGVDVPEVDTVMMLRPTESRLLWLQQFGRGLRKVDKKTHLTVIDYIGNHRTFLLKPQTLFQLAPGDKAIDRTLSQLLAGQADLPPGCEVTYDLRAVDIIRGLLRVAKDGEALKAYYEDFRERNGVRPRASEAFHEGCSPRSARPTYGSWLHFVRSMGDLPAQRGQVFETHVNFLNALETTPMAKSYKMALLLAMLNEDALPGDITIERLTRAFAETARRSGQLHQDVTVPLEDTNRLRRLLEDNPIAAWSGGKGTGDVPYFAYDNGVFRFAVSVPPDQREAFQELVREIIEWRVAEYLERSGGSTARPDAQTSTPYK